MARAWPGRSTSATSCEPCGEPAPITPAARGAPLARRGQYGDRGVSGLAVPGAAAPPARSPRPGERDLRCLPPDLSRMAVSGLLPLRATGDLLAGRASGGR